MLTVETFGKDKCLELVFEERESHLIDVLDEVVPESCSFSFLDGRLCSSVSTAGSSFLPVRFTSDVNVSEAAQIV